MENLVYIGIGSNIGNRIHFVKAAIDKIDGIPECKVEKISSLYESKPFGKTDQENFVNLVILVKTFFEPTALFNFLKQIESKMGRKNLIRWGPREIDLDILFYNDLIYNDDKLAIPHKGIAERDFVLVPLCEIAPDFIHPEINEKICDICNTELKKNVICKIPQSIFVK
ncbi:MAG: 2-amino-4-hydroxy-6-hydroxymethyldihydropteridine diphosphokinase [Ignavibacteriaceae bacterium]|nr:2-amino-4-hydroxy-6-hydroxymethyldihydropteridine diphosphokinase [Ignavibacteriaceae bacterium]